MKTKEVVLRILNDQFESMLDSLINIRGGLLPNELRGIKKRKYERIAKQAIKLMKEIEAIKEMDPESVAERYPKL